MSTHEYHLIAVGWSILIIFLTVFWYATLSRLAVVLKDHLDAEGSHQSVPGIFGMFRFLVRGRFKQTGDARVIAICTRLRSLLLGYIGAAGAYIVFMIIMRTRV
jgi:hypothetical protein